jgi:chorismate mutase
MKHKGERMKKMIRSDLSNKLKEKRKKIDLIDRKLLTLLNQRLRIALGGGKIKKEMGKKIYDPRREKEILRTLHLRNRGPLTEEGLKKIFATIIKVCRQSQR